MSFFIEFEGRTVEQALNKASETLSVPIEQLKHDVISFGATGIFGIVAEKKARIRVAGPDVSGSTIKVESGENVSSPAELGRQFLRNIIGFITSENEILVEVKTNKVVYSIRADDPSVIAGRNGKTLSAIQYILNTMITRSSGNRMRVMVRVEGKPANSHIKS